MSNFYLSDDGTMDTVVTCKDCGRDCRYTFDGEVPTNDAPDRDAYDCFIEWCFEDASETHECLEEV